MFDKETTFSVINTKFAVAKDLNSGLDKLASSDSLYKMPEKLDPEFLYIWVRSISAGEYWGLNKNSDWFAERELVDSHHTFMEAHVFKNHDNKDVAKAIGQVLLAVWNSEMKCVELLIKIDRMLAPEIVRAFEKGYSTDVSMGCRVQHTVCSICGNVARRREDFCEHVRFHRGEIMPDGKRVYEINIKPRFHDISVVLNGADRTAKVLEFVSEVAGVGQDRLAKTAALNRKIDGSPSMLEKVASLSKDTFKDLSLGKLAEIQKEISDKLYVIALLERLSKEGQDPDILAETYETLDADMKTAEIVLAAGMEKVAGPFKTMRNLALGTTGVALATNFYQGKRMRGDELSDAQNFIADNPGTLPLAFAISYPIAARLARKTKSYHKYPLLHALASENSDDFIEKEAACINHACDCYINIFNSPEVANSFKTAYHVNDDRLSLIKLAITLGALDSSMSPSVLEKTSLDESELSNFLDAGYQEIVKSIEKEAGFWGNTIASGAFVNHELHGVNPGLAGTVATGALIDGLIITKLMSGGKDKKTTKVELAEEIAQNPQQFAKDLSHPQQFLEPKNSTK